MPKGMIVTVGTQCKQIEFCLAEKQPEYLVLLCTRTAGCAKTIDDLLKACPMPPTHVRILNEVDDAPSEIGKIVQEFQKGLQWLTQDRKIPESEIEVDPTGGRKWMSAGVTMVASLRGLQMVYVQEPPNMAVVPLGNAYDQAGFLDEDRGDKFFDARAFAEAIGIYSFLAGRLREPRRVQVKLHTARAYDHMTRFEFAEAHAALGDAEELIREFSLLREWQGRLSNQRALLGTLRRNDGVKGGNGKESFFNLLQDRPFAESALVHLLLLEEYHASQRQYGQAVLLLYRALELLAQHRLALRAVDASDISQEVRSLHGADFARISRKVHGAARELSRDVGLVDAWILLLCMKDGLVNDESFIGAIKQNSQVRNGLWLIHGNASIAEKEWKVFSAFVRREMTRAVDGLLNRLDDYRFATVSATAGL